RFTPLYATVTERWSAVVLPSVLDAVTVICQRPLVSSNGVENELSEPTGTVTGDGPRGDGAGAPPPAGAAGPRYVAETTTWAAFVAVPPIGIAPFSKLAPSAGESTVSVGACTTEKGTLMMIWTFCSEILPVSGSVAQTVKSLRPRRRVTSCVHEPSAPAETCVVWSGASWMFTVPRGIVVPRSV